MRRDAPNPAAPDATDAELVLLDRWYEGAIEMPDRPPPGWAVSPVLAGLLRGLSASGRTPAAQCVIGTAGPASEELRRLMRVVASAVEASEDLLVRSRLYAANEKRVPSIRGARVFRSDVLTIVDNYYAPSLRQSAMNAYGPEAHPYFSRMADALGQAASAVSSPARLRDESGATGYKVGLAVRFYPGTPAQMAKVAARVLRAGCRSLR